MKAQFRFADGRVEIHDLDQLYPVWHLTKKIKTPIKVNITKEHVFRLRYNNDNEMPIYMETHVKVVQYG